MRRSALALALAAAGCAVGPDYEEPGTAAPEAFENAERMPTDPALAAWWKAFGDPGLDALLARAVKGNHDVRAAAALLREARAIHARESFAYAPTVRSQAGYTRQLLSDATFLDGVPREDRTFGYYSAGFDASWELDFFGRVRRLNEAASADVEQVEATGRDVLLSLLAEVARTWFDLKGARQRLGLARRSAEIQAETLAVTMARAAGGRGTELDVHRARSSLESTRAAIPAFETELVAAKNRLAVLLGESPSGFRPDDDPAGPPPPLPARVSIGRPADLLRRRPDIRIAERRLAAATARIGVATADLFPRVTLGATFGPQASTISGLSSAGALAYSFGPQLTWAAFDLGRVAAQIRAADARAEADLHRYQQVVLKALEETETALVRYGRERVRRDALAEAVDAGEKAAVLADVRYQAGAADFLTTLDARRSVLILQLELAESQTRTATSLVALYKALGGGWEAVP